MTRPTSSMRATRPLAATRAARRDGSTARLALAEVLLATDDLAVCLQRAVDWLVAHGGGQQVVLAALDPRSDRPGPVVGHGVDPAQLRELVVDLEDRADPLVAALIAGGARFEPGPDAPSTPLGRVAFAALPITGPAGCAPVGLLLLAPAATPLPDDVRWVIMQLGAKLAAAHARSRLEDEIQSTTAAVVEQHELLRRERLAVEQASAAKSQFLANMSHELRTPLNAIMGYTSMLLQGVAGPLSPQQDKYTNRIESSSKRLLAVINDCLDVSRIEAGRMPVDLGDVHLPELIEEVVTELEPLRTRSKLPVGVEHDISMPALRTDRRKLKQIVVNLLANALKFTRDGWVRISTVVDPVAREVTIAVTDTGIGIAADQQQQVFGDFFQLDSSLTRPYTGAGLGLAICRRLAEMLGGSITVTSEVGCGSTFTLHLPARVRASSRH